MVSTAAEVGVLEVDLVVTGAAARAVAKVEVATEAARAVVVRAAPTAEVGVAAKAACKVLR